MAYQKAKNGCLLTKIYICFLKKNKNKNSNRTLVKHTKRSMCILLMGRALDSTVYCFEIADIKGTWFWDSRGCNKAFLFLIFPHIAGFSSPWTQHPVQGLSTVHVLFPISDALQCILLLCSSTLKCFLSSLAKPSQIWYEPFSKKWGYLCKYALWCNKYYVVASQTSLCSLIIGIFLKKKRKEGYFKHQINIQM